MIKKLYGSLVSPLFVCSFLFFTPVFGFAQETKTVDGMVQIEKNHLYMIPIGTENGVAKGDVVEILRIGVKVAEARLISVLPDTSMAEMLTFINVNEVFESDVVRYVSRSKALPQRRILTSDQSGSREPDSSVESRAQDKRGLLGSDTSIDRQVYLARVPLQKEVDGLKVGLEVLKDEFDGKMEAVMGTAAGGTSRTALTIEKKWRQKLEETDSKYQEQLERQKETLQAEFRRERESLEQKIAALTKQIGAAGQTGDVRTRQLMTDLKSTDTAIDMLKQTFEQQRLFDEGKWNEKVSELEQRYQNQLRIQQGEFRHEFQYASDRYKDEIADLKEKIFSLQDAHKVEIAKIQADMKGRDREIAAAAKEKAAAEEKLRKVNSELVKSKKEIVEIKDDLASTRSTYSEKVEAMKRPLENKTKELNDQLAALKKSYDEQLSLEKRASEEKIKQAQEEALAQVAAVEQKYKNDFIGLKVPMENELESLKAELAQKESNLALLTQERTELNQKNTESESHAKQLMLNVRTLQEELAREKATRDDSIKEVKESLEQEIQRTSKELVAVVDDYESKIRDLEETTRSAMEDSDKKWLFQVNKLEEKTKEDKTLIEFLNGEMAALTGELDERDKQIAQFEKDLFREKRERDKDTATIAEKIKRAEKPLNAAIEKLTFNLADTKDKYEAQIREFKEKSGGELQNREKEWQAKLDAKNDTHLKELVTLKNDSQEQVNAVLAGMAELKADYEGKLQSVRDSSKDLLASSEGQWQKTLEETIARHQQEMDTLRGDKDSQIQALEGRVVQLTGDYEQKITAMTESSAADLTSTQEQWQKQIQALQAERDQEIALLTQSNEELVGDLKAQIAGLTKDYENKLAEQQAQSNTEFSSSKELWESQLAAQKEDHQKELEALTQDARDKEAQLKEELIRKTGEYEQKLTMLTDSSAASLASSEDQWLQKFQGAQGEHEQEVALLVKNNEELVTALKAQITGLTKDYEDRLGAQQEKFSEELTAAQMSWQNQMELSKNEFQKERDSAVLNAQKIDESRKKAIAAVEDLNRKLAEKDKNLETLKKENMSLASDLNKRGKELAQLEGDMVNLNENLAQSKLSHAEKMKFAQLSMAEKAKGLISEIASLKKSHAQKVIDLQKKSDEEMLNTENQWQQRLSSTEKDLQQRVDRQKTEYEQKIAGLNKTLGDLTKDKETSVAGLEQRVNEKEKLINALKDKNSGLETGFRNVQIELAKLREENTRLSDTHKRASEAHERELASVRSVNEQIIKELNDTVVSLKKEQAAKIEELQQKADKNLASTEAQWSDRWMAREKELNQTIENQKKEHEKTVAGLSRTIASLEDTKGSLEKGMSKKDEMMKKLEANIAQLNDDFAQTKSTHAEKLKFARMSLEEKIKSLNEELLATRGDYEKRMKEARRKADQTVAEANKTLDEKLALKEKENQQKLENQRKEYEVKISDIQQKATDGLLVKEKEVQNKLVDQESRWQEKSGQIRDQYEGQIAALNEQLKTLRDGSDHRAAMLKEEVEKEQRANAALKIDITNLSQDLNEKDRQLAKRTDEIADLEKRIDQESNSYNKRIELAKESLGAENAMLKSELAFARENHEENLKFVQERAANDLRVAQEQFQAKLNANDARWKVQLVTLEEGHRKELSSGTQALQAQITNNRGALRETIDELNDRLSMLKNASEIQIKELEDELAAQQQKLTLREGEFQARYTEAENRWAAKLAEEQQKNQASLMNEKKNQAENFLKEKQELRQSVTDLTAQLRQLRDTSSKRIKDLETDLEKRDYKLGLIENHVDKANFDVEEKWRTKMIALEKDYQQKLIDQRRELEQRFLSGKEVDQSTVTDMSRQLDALREQARLDLKLKEEEAAAELAIVQGKHQKEIGELNNQHNRNLEDLSSKLKFQSSRIDELERERSGLAYELQQKDLSLNNSKNTFTDWQKEKRMLEISHAEKMRLARESAQAKIDELSSLVTNAKEKALQEKAAIDEQWRARIKQLEEEYQNKQGMISGEKEELLAKIRYQSGLVDSLEKAKSDLEYELQQREQVLTNSKEAIGNLKKETRLNEVSLSEKLKLTRETSQAKIDELTAQLAIAQQEAIEEKSNLEDRWRVKLNQVEEDYRKKLALQEQNLKAEIEKLNTTLSAARNNTSDEISQMRREVQDNQTLIQLLSREKQGLMADLDRRSREVVNLNEEIIGLKEDAEKYKNLMGASAGLATRSGGLGILETQPARIASGKEVWYPNIGSTAEYHDYVRKAILSKFQEFDFSSFTGKEGVVKIDFVLMSDGTPKQAPEFLGARSDGLKSLLMKCFESAAPFPPFPKSLNKSSQRFALSVSFEQK